MKEIEINLNGIRDKRNFFSIMKNKFLLPTYFSFGFDSLDECMRDLSWFVEENITVRIKGLDKVKARSLHLYQDINEGFELYKEYWSNNCDKKKVTFIISNR